jgi:hypothetical protein
MENSFPGYDQTGNYLTKEIGQTKGLDRNIMDSDGSEDTHEGLAPHRGAMGHRKGMATR